MKKIFVGLILAWSTITPIHAQFDPTRLIPETLRYRLQSGSTQVGSSTVTISHDNANGTLHIVESISGLFEQTAIVTIRNDTSLQPLATQAVFSRDNQYHDVQLHYSRDGKRVTGEIRRPPDLGGVCVIDVTFPNAAVDVYAAPHLLRASPLLIGKTIQFPLFNVLQNEKSLARAWVAKIETVTVAAGRFECFRLESFLGNSRLILNIDTQFPHRMIRQILPALQIKFELAEVE
ncbi:MAG: DUF3108 domain-containing protein [candidate division KSB1 bacterium]|nr:DUF3108 domain-containing protein [candidate division KSB1 bacterium]MDZ7368165.1 DUF3108 domain-containing protein [candidate division KSB1 bacterium]MDZ7405944.1 DUF3108 domain-containing protein [candidate division KSB1 bacterium]